jgi:hypothetical protein
MNGGNTKDAAMKQFITNKIIPEWCSLRDMLNAFILPKFNLQNTKYIDFDTSDIPELSDDLSTLIPALAQAWWLTGNEKRIRTGDEPDMAEPNMNKYLIPQGLTPIDEAGLTGMGVDPNGDLSSAMKLLADRGIRDYGR